tara:strand:+ start:2507 stop:2896 length:390 start_codon:yes stop_codon:yes gene_type:complete
MILFLKNIAGVILGVVCGMIVNMSLIIGGHYMFPLPEYLDPMNAINWALIYFLFPLLAHAIGTFSGAFISSKVWNNIAAALIVGIYFLLGGIYMVVILPAPLWFICLDLTICYIPMALLAWCLNKKEQL